MQLHAGGVHLHPELNLRYVNEAPKIQNQPLQPGMIPGYEEAVAFEHKNRAGSFTEAAEVIKGFPLCLMTLGQFDKLRFLKNPLLFKDIPSMSQLFDFLWLLNPSYSPSESSARRKVIKGLRKYYEPPEPILRTAIRLYFYHQKHLLWYKDFLELIAALNGYVEEQFYDSPGFNKGSEKSYFCDIAAFVDMFGSEYGRTVQEVLAMPLNQVFQLQKAILKRTGSKRLFNKSDRKLGEFVDSLNRKSLN